MYSIPIQVPPGIAGMEPKLALTYSSQAGNGLLGVGWKIDGLSAITRCPRTLAQDGVRGGVNLDSNDRYCLDGQRLMVISGTYGANGSEYRTELDSFSRIISYGTAGNGPAYFKVWTKSGLIMEYGNTADSFIVAEGKTSARAYAVNKTTDTKGNYLTVAYTQESTDFRPATIAYTGNGAQAPSNSVDFTYASRSDIAPLYLAGSKIEVLKLLSNVKTYVGSTFVKEYRLTYVSSPSSSRSVLSSIKECDTFGVSGNCFAPINFAWQGGTEGSFGASLMTYPNGWNFGLPTNYLPIVGDFNGDGRADYMLTGDAQQFVFLSNGDGTFSSSLTYYPNGWNFGLPTNYKPIVGDFNGDGKTDYMLTGDVQQFVFLSNGDGTFSANLMTYPNGWNFGLPTNYLPIVGDFNGDGRTDYMLTGDAQQFVFLSNGDGTFSSSLTYYPNGWNFGLPTAYKPVVGDFNADGKTDYMLTGDVQQFVFLSNGDGTFSANLMTYPNGWNFGLPTNYLPIGGDFNGDGKTDYMLTGSTQQFVFLSKGDGTFTASLLTYPNGWNFGLPTNYVPIVGDFSGDGRTDYMLTGDAQQFVFLSNGDGTFSSSLTYYPNGWNFGLPTNFRPIVGDFSGDGKTDYMLTGGTQQYVFLAGGVLGDLLTSITNSLGATTAISYLPITNSIYTKDSGGYAAVYPQVDLQAPIYVVSSASMSDGVGGTVSTTYHYGGAKADYAGRGFLGFRWTLAENSQSGIILRTEYAQNWPYVGLPSLMKKSTSGGVMLSQVTNTYNCKDYDGDPCTVGAGKRYFPYVEQSVNDQKDLNGAALPSILTTNLDVDDYGNVRLITVSAYDGNYTQTENFWANDVNNWILGRLVKSTVTRTIP